ncbi:hypothetical protein S40288_05925 [Stachybotrys chartarum IBT 40288]|nr:hypothetical protein S40288_05925 [Stachybotrys chartarum IBT 40288]
MGSPQQEQQQLLLPIVDSHIHLYTEGDVDRHAWATPDHPLRGAHSVAQYKAAAQPAPSLLGYVFVEVDRKYSGPDDWANQLAELDYLRRVALGQPRDGDDAAPEDARMCLGIVPWAPVPQGADALERYLKQAEEVAGEAWVKVKGFRYLLQDKPDGTMLTEDFVEGIKLLGRRGFTFDVGVDHHRRGKKQLDELLELIRRAHDGVPDGERVTFIINHLCKPDLSIYNTSSDPSFISWREAIQTLSKNPKTYMKLSGAFSEMPASLIQGDASQLFQSLFSWLAIVLATFGPARIMFGSDWPVCEVATESAWPRWRDLVDKMCWMASLGDEERAMIYGGTAKVAYKL